MDNGTLLELTLRDILQQISPSEEDWNIRRHIINDIRVVVQSVECFRGATVEPYGSFVSDLFTRWGDMDISIELPNGLYISYTGRKNKLRLLEELQNALLDRGEPLRKLLYIPNARIPILKFHTKFKVNCDISINNLSGQMKSKILYWIGMIDKRFRDMVLLVKEWAKTHRINDAKAGSMNSYSLTLLVLFHLQTCEPPILPPLREIYPGNMAENLTGVRVNAERMIEETCLHNINQYKNDTTRMINQSFLSEIFFSFIQKFCDITDRASMQGVCPYNGQWEDIHTNTRWLPKTYAFFIEDPFEQPANAARTVIGRELENISEAFQTTYNVLLTPSLDRLSLLSALVSPHISQFLTRVPFVGSQHDNGTRPLPHWPPATPPASHSRDTRNDWRHNGRVDAYHDWRGPNRSIDVHYNDWQGGPNIGVGAYNGWPGPNRRADTSNDWRANRGIGAYNDWRDPNNSVGAYNEWRGPNNRNAMENGRGSRGRGRGRGRNRRADSENGRGGNGSVGTENNGRHDGSTSTSTETDGRPPNESTDPEDDRHPNGNTGPDGKEAKI